MRTGGHLLQLVARLVQHPGHGRRAGRQGRAAEQHVADPLAAPVGIGLLEHQDRPLGQLRQAAPLRPAPRLVHQPGRTQLLELLLPGVERVLRDAHQRGEVPRRQAAPLPGVEDQQPLLRVRARAVAARRGLASTPFSRPAKIGRRKRRGIFPVQRFLAVRDRLPPPPNPPPQDHRPARCPWRPESATRSRPARRCRTPLAASASRRGSADIALAEATSAFGESLAEGLFRRRR